MDKKQKKKLNESIVQAFYFTIEFITIVLKGIFCVAIMVGVVASFLLYYKTYPSEAIKLFNAFDPIFIILFKMFGLLVGISFGVLIGWLGFNIIEPIISRRKIRQEKRREEFLTDLATKMNKKLKKK